MAGMQPKVECLPYGSCRAHNYNYKTDNGKIDLRIAGVVAQLR
ncbi:hypothetical protein ACPOL_0701 [Acidisarcina polymorpha]|uniref:Uncharacterized protein n=1 Tax=Acidisarcina polymorpha TaxID=2211140 RepID=A0A2Z5FUA1_9BACT|nr:hypothetical protein ACPOL_0701 [Acidisarcina polymorpha]